MKIIRKIKEAVRTLRQTFGYPLKILRSEPEKPELPKGEPIQPQKARGGGVSGIGGEPWKPVWIRAGKDGKENRDKAKQKGDKARTGSFRKTPGKTKARKTEKANEGKRAADIIKPKPGKGGATPNCRDRKTACRRYSWFGEYTLGDSQQKRVRYSLFGHYGSEGEHDEGHGKRVRHDDIGKKTDRKSNKAPSGGKTAELRNGDAVKKKRFRWKWILSVTMLLVLLGCLLYAAWMADYTPAENEALRIAAGKGVGSSIRVTKERGYLVFAPEEPVAGLIFYPGERVQYEAYAPLMRKCAQQGVLCILVHMPSNMAALKPDAAENLPAQYPQVADWYLAGHGMGGQAAADYIAGHADQYRGLILLATWSAADLRDSGLKVLTILGTEDGLLDREAYNRYRSNLPESFSEYIMAGGNHANFGAYGAQKGDGTPTITAEDQLQQTANAIVKCITA